MVSSVAGPKQNHPDERDIGKKNLHTVRYGSVILSHRRVSAYSFDTLNEPVNTFRSLSCQTNKKQNLHRQDSAARAKN